MIAGANGASFLILLLNATVAEDLPCYAHSRQQYLDTSKSLQNVLMGLLTHT
jgi:hypothetical protein